MNAFDDTQGSDTRRRQLLRAAASVPLLALPGIGRASAGHEGGGARTLRFYHAHTGEKLRVSYWENGAYLPDALAEINAFMRDFRTGEVATMAPGLLDIAHRIRSIAGGGSYTLFSAYRSPRTNEALRKRSNGVAKKSFHMQGRALDIRLEGVPASRLRDIAVSLRAGGVGLYSSSGFVHIDTGPVRQW